MTARVQLRGITIAIDDRGMLVERDGITYSVLWAEPPPPLPLPAAPPTAECTCFTGFPYPVPCPAHPDRSSR
jgi:hypothetical protein